MIRTLFVGCCTLALGFSHSWMDAQIKEDLAYFQNKKLSRAAIGRAFREGITKAADVAHIAICDRGIKVLGLRSSGWWGIEARLHEVVKELERWQRVARVCPSRRLVDCELLISLGDGLDTGTSTFDATNLSVPVFTFCKRRGSNRLVLFPDNHALKRRQPNVHLIRQGRRRFPWKKKQAKLFFRGAGSDGTYTLENWATFPRAKLVLVSQQLPEIIDAGFTNLPQTTTPSLAKEIFTQVGGPRAQVSPLDHLAYKYLMDIDGNSNGWERCFWGLLSNSTLFKQKSPYAQWYYKALKPWVHYVPVERDLEDLKERVIWIQEHDEKALEIAEKGQELAEEIFKRQVVFEYIQELLRSYAALFNDTESR